MLGNGQYYCLSLSEEKSSIKLSIILLPDNQHSSKERKELLDYVQSKLEAVIADFLPATKKPVAYIPCCYCDRMHVRLQLLLDGKQQHCSAVKDKPLPKNHYCHLVTDQGEYSIPCALYCHYIPLLIADDQIATRPPKQIKSK